MAFDDFYPEGHQGGGSYHYISITATADCPYRQRCLFQLTTTPVSLSGLKVTQV